jgi:copper chaperone
MNHTFTVTGMTCGHCEKAVTRALKTIDPQAQVVIDRSQNRVQVESGQAREVLAQAIVEGWVCGSVIFFGDYLNF